MAAPVGVQPPGTNASPFVTDPNAAAVATELFQDAPVAERYMHVPETVEGLRKLCGQNWIDSNLLDLNGRQVGEGAFATVLRGNVTLPDGTKRVAAIKRLKPSMLSDRDFKDFVLEAAVLSKLDHPCIVKMFGVGTTCTATLSSDSFYYVSEFCDGGNLKDLLYKQMEVSYKRMYTPHDALRWALQIARGLRYLHASRPMVIHRDLKPENILLTGPRNARVAKISDFGLSVLVGFEEMRSQRLTTLTSMRNVSGHTLSTTGSTEAHGVHSSPGAPSPPTVSKPGFGRQISHAPMRSMTLQRFTATSVTNGGSLTGKANAYQLTGMTGSLLYMAPESYNKSEYNEKVDVFSFAMIMFELLMYELTYYAMQCRDQVSDLVTYVEGVCIDGDRPEIPDRIPEPLRKLITRCWAQDPDARPTMDEVTEELRAYMAANNIPESGGKAQQDGRAVGGPACACCIS